MPLNSALVAAFGPAEEIEISSYRKDGTLRRWVPIWSVPVGDAVYVRSAFGVDGGWYKWAKISGVARVHAGGVESDVRLVPDTADDVQQAVDAGFRAKYPAGGESTRIMVTEPARSATVRLEPTA